jgi:hypothetical protein
MDRDHLDPDKLAALAVGGGREPAHLASCERCRGELDGLRSLVSELRSRIEVPADLLDAAKEFFRRRRRLDDLIERLASDPALRARARTKPRDVLADAGLEPSPELVEAIRDPDRASGDVARRWAATLWR